MAFIITGDIHGTIDIEKVVQFFEEHDTFTEDDYLVICGDVGVCGFSLERERETRKILQNLPVTTLFVDGNHEHFKHLNAYPIEVWNGGKVHFVENNIIHLMRGQVYEIDGVRLFSFGGAHSTDWMYRQEGISWFSEEIPSRNEYEEGWENLVAADFRVDYIVTHTAPREVAAAMGYGELSDEEVELRKYLQQVAEKTEFEAWYFGHFHEDTEIEDTFYCLYDTLQVIE